MSFVTYMILWLRVWRYRGGRDGHETLQQFMNFLGRQPLPPPLEQETLKESVYVPKRSSKVYPGVVVFCVPELAESERQSNIDISNLQVN